MSIAKKIAIVTPVFPPYRGGMGTAAFHHARLLAARGQEVTVFTPDYGLQTSLKPPSNSPLEGGRIELLKPVLKYGNAAWVPQLTQMLKDFDVVILEYPFFGGMRAVHKAKKRYGFKFVLFYHMDLQFRGIKGLLFWYATRFFLPRIMQTADVVLASSEDYALNSNLKTYWKAKDKKFRVLPFGVDRERFMAAEPDATLRKNFNLAPDEQVVLFVGGLDAAHYFKGVEYLIKAVPCVRAGKFKVVIAGRGALQEQYKKFAEELGARGKVFFTGGVSDAMLVKLYQLATVTVLPSIDQSESFGIVLAESMACGTPVVSSDLPGVRSVYENEVSGVTVPARDERALASTISDMLNNPARAKEMGHAAQKRAEERYDWQVIGDALLKLVE